MYSPVVFFCAQQKATIVRVCAGEDVKVSEDVRECRVHAGTPFCVFWVPYWSIRIHKVFALYV